MEKVRQIRSKIEHWHIIAFYLCIYDIISSNGAYFFGLFTRFDFRFSVIPDYFFQTYLKFIPFYTIAVVLVYYFMHLYKSIWRFASFSELNRITIANAILAVFHILGTCILFNRMPVSYYIIGIGLQYACAIFVRFVYRYITMERSRRVTHASAEHNVMVIGAGAAGQIIIKELQNSKELNSKPCCVIDDNRNKHGRFMEGVPIVGDRHSIMRNVEKYQIDQIMFAIPTASAKQKRDILNICKETKCELKSLPGIFQMAKGDVSISKMKPVSVEDLLGREPIRVNMDEIFQHIKGKRILVTGGGGSIGSELCRQIAAHEPELLIIFDIYENNAYDIEQELKRKYGTSLNLTVLIGSVRDSIRINHVFETYKPDIVYHAAAHKHVPLMESSPNESIKNNVVGTYKTAAAALKHGTQRFVLISTDKAVNPTNIMGASKRLCEMIIQSMDVISRTGRTDLLPILSFNVNETISDEFVMQKLEEIEKNCLNEDQLISSCDKEKISGRTQFVAVRFGNVLGSNGSVIPLFKRQIEEGGPVTVTHPDIIRYFMTIPEAVSLVLQAGTYAWGGEIFVLDMGEPVKIDSLARNLIQLSGFEPGVDIDIQYVGLRQGEKLYEEKLMAEEGIKKTDNDLIHIGKPIPFNIEIFMKSLYILAKASHSDSQMIVEIVEKIVSTYKPTK